MRTTRKIVFDGGMFWTKRPNSELILSSFLINVFGWTLVDSQEWFSLFITNKWWIVGKSKLRQIQFNCRNRKFRSRKRLKTEMNKSRFFFFEIFVRFTDAPMLRQFYDYFQQPRLSIIEFIS